MANILVAGGTGLIGRQLINSLKKAGYETAVLSRSKRPDFPATVFQWNPDNNQLDIEALKFADIIINLAGESLSDSPWTDKRKQQIIDSRVHAANVIYESARAHKLFPQAYVSASAIGYYGQATQEHIFKEVDAPGNDFLAKVCVKWERAADLFKNAKIRTVKIRIGVVLSSRGGVLEKMLKPAKMGIGVPLGNGNQYMPWIHIDDVCGIFFKAIDNIQLNGVFNATAPEHITNKEFTATLNKVLKKNPVLPPVPGFLLKLRYGEMAKLMLEGSRISSQKIKDTGYVFKFSRLEPALRNLLIK